jgi:hypothetical protein
VLQLELHSGFLLIMDKLKANANTFFSAGLGKVKFWVSVACTPEPKLMFIGFLFSVIEYLHRDSTQLSFRIVFFIVVVVFV